MDFRHCLSPYCIIDQVITSCMALLMKGPRFTFAHTEIGGGAFFAFLKKRIKIWCASTSSRGTRLFERCCHSLEGFIELMQRDPREREVRYLQFTLQRPGDLIYIPQLLAHALLTLNTGSPTNLFILSAWDAATTTNQETIFQTLDEYTFGVRRGKWREIFCKKALSALREWVFVATGPQESKERLEKDQQYWEKHSPDLLNTLFIEGPVTNKKVHRRPPIQTKGSISLCTFLLIITHRFLLTKLFLFMSPSDYHRKQTLKLK